MITILISILITSIIFFFTIVFGVITMLVESIVNLFKRTKPNIFMNTLRELYKNIKLALINLVVLMSEFTNVIAGCFLYRLFVKKKCNDKTCECHNTLFGKSEVTISAALGHASEFGIISDFGVMIMNALSSYLDEDHCISAYENYLQFKEYKKGNAFHKHIMN